LVPSAPDPQNTRLSFNSIVGLDSIPFYVVGQTTATALADVFSSFSHLGLGSPDIKGQSSGNAASLATFILDDLKERPAKLLYLTGDKNRDTLPQLLNDGGISLQSLQVYETRGASSFEDSLASALSSSSEGTIMFSVYNNDFDQPFSDEDYWWIVYFAPSAAAYVTPILRKHFLIQELQSKTTIPTLSDLRRTKVAAIGPTTDSFLRDDLHLHVHAVAPKPVPDEIVSVIKSNDTEKL
jgi:uroporphyrinogen-III synthase